MLPPLKRARRHATPQPQTSPPLHTSLASFAEAYAQGHAESLGLRHSGSDSALETSNVDIGLMLRLFPETALAQHLSEAAEKLAEQDASCQSSESYVWPEAAEKLSPSDDSRQSHGHTEPGKAAEKLLQPSANCQSREASPVLTTRTTRATSAKDSSSAGDHEGSAAVRQALPDVRQNPQRKRRVSRWDQPATQQLDSLAVRPASPAVRQEPAVVSRAHAVVSQRRPRKRRGVGSDLPEMQEPNDGAVRQTSPTVRRAETTVQQQTNVAVRRTSPGDRQAQRAAQQQDGAAVRRASPGVAKWRCYPTGASQLTSSLVKDCYQTYSRGFFILSHRRDSACY